MIYLLLFVLLIAVLVGPSIWVKRVLKKYAGDRAHIPGTGAEFAQHLLLKLGYEKVGVEKTLQGDHYDPEAQKVRLSEAHFAHKSLVAMVVAAHEVGHAIQHQQRQRLFQRRIQLVKIAAVTAKIAPVALAISPILLAVV